MVSSLDNTTFSTAAVNDCVDDAGDLMAGLAGIGISVLPSGRQARKHDIKVVKDEMAKNEDFACGVGHPCTKCQINHTAIDYCVVRSPVRSSTSGEFVHAVYKNHIQQ